MRIVLNGVSQVIEAAVADRVVTGVAERKCWLQLEAGACSEHLGMTDSILDATEDEAFAELPAHQDRAWGRAASFLKLWLETEDGRRVAMVDGRAASPGCG